MRPLLALQARILLRWATGRAEGAVLLPLTVAAVLLGGFLAGTESGDPFIFVLGAAFSIWVAMVQTIGTLEEATASVPLLRGTVLRAYVLFWTGAWILAAGTLAVLQGGLREADGVLFRTLMVCGAAAIGWVLIVHEAVRRASAGVWVVAGLLLLGSLPTLGFLLLFATVIHGTGGGTGPDLFFIGLPAVAVNLAVGCFLLLRSGGKAPAVPGAGAREPAPAAARRSAGDGETAAAGRSPTSSILRSTFLTWRALPWFLIGFLGLHFRGGADWDAFTIGFFPLCAANVAIAALGTMRWLSATSISRARAFRILLAPYLGLLLLGLASRAVVVEVQDRTVLYENHWHAYPDSRGVSPIQCVPIDSSRQAEKDVLGGDPEALVARTSDHLARRFGIRDGGGRVREAILGGWPGGGGTPPPEAVNTEVRAALDRVREAFHPELAAVLHRRMLADALASLVLGLLLLCVHLGIRAPWKTLIWFLLVLPLVLSMLPTLGLGERAGALALRDGFYGAFTASPIPCALAALAVAALLLRLAFAGFRRLEYDNLPPATAKDLVQ